MPWLHIGCCGWARGRLAYFRSFRLIEVQQTFYKPPGAATALRWRQEAPEGFEFALKAWQLITHPASSPTYRKAGIRVKWPEHYGAFRLTDEVTEAWERTREIATILRARWIIFQCPASFTPTEEHRANLRRFFRSVERGPFRFGWEPRGEGWDDRTIRQLTEELGLIHVTDPFTRLPVTPSVAYFRLHGVGGYRYRYTSDDLARLLSWCQGYDEVYCLFNNVWSWESATEFLRLAASVQDPPNNTP
jgi:uncharacterized protein YecE (DUF72 family)